MPSSDTSGEPPFPSTATEPTTDRPRRLFTADSCFESLVLFVIGFALMHFFYAGTGGVAGSERGVPGNDSFYHIKMSAMIPEWRLVKEFPWLQHAYFTSEGHAFVSHHYGFHMLMLPFVQLSNYLNPGDYLSGGRWATSVFFGVVLTTFNLLLISEGVRWRWLWLMLFLFMPGQFFVRHGYVRAITPSLALMLLSLLALFRGRNLLAGVFVLAFTHLYLGGVTFAPVVVAMFAVANVIGRPGQRVWPWKPVLLPFCGWLVGVLTYPYAHGMVEFLRLQVFGTGLSPDIPVGQEWQAYTDLWWVAQMIGPTIAVWAMAMALRARLGPPLNARELSLVLIQFAMMVLMAKARRFVEYWPIFCLLSSAYLVAPWLSVLASRVENLLLWPDRPRAQTEYSSFAALLLGACVSLLLAAGVALFTASRQPDTVGLAVEWQALSALAALYCLPMLVHIWIGRRSSDVDAVGTTGAPASMVRVLMVPLFGGLIVAVVWLLLRARFPEALQVVGKLHLGLAGWLTLAAVYLVVTINARAQRAAIRGFVPARILAALCVVVGAVGWLGATAAAAGAQLLDIQRSSRCGYDVGAIRRMMDVLKSRSQPGDVVFTDDWDVFPVYFYYNSFNYYIVGLDPKFTHERHPDLWQRYVKVSRGEIPADTWYTRRDDKGPEIRERIHVELADIRTHFGCRYVITDRDHKALAAKLAAARDFAELIYPVSDYNEAKNAPYLLFRVREPGEEAAAATPLPGDDQGTRYLSQLTPVSVQQGFGDLMSDVSVDGAAIRIGEEIHARGLGTHAPSRLVYDIPEGFEYFEATVGVDRETEGRGSVIASVSLDDTEPMWTSPLLTGSSAPVNVRIGLAGAKRLILRADATSDGDRFDHVDWGSARLVRTPE